MSEQLPAGTGAHVHILGYNTPTELQTIHATYPEANVGITLDPLALWIRNEGSWTQVATATGASVSTASESTSGIAPLATQAQTDAGVDDTRIVTPLKLATRTVTSPRVFDEFDTFVGWISSVGGTVTYEDGSLGHPGIIGLSTTTTSGTYSVVHRVTAGVGNVLPADNFDLTWIIQLRQTDAATLVRFGLGRAVTTNPPTDGIYVEKLAADTSW